MIIKHLLHQSDTGQLIGHPTAVVRNELVKPEPASPRYPFQSTGGVLRPNERPLEISLVKELMLLFHLLAYFASALRLAICHLPASL